MVSEEERALRLELQDLTKKRQALNTSRRQGSAVLGGGLAGRRSVLSRLGGVPTRTGGGTDRNAVRQKENNSRGNASWRRGKRNHEDNYQITTFKKQKLHSAVAKPEVADDAEERAEASRTSTVVVVPAATNTRTQERKQRAVAPYAQKDGIARSKRMFGALMGHLGKAKRQIEKDTHLFKRQDTKQQEAEQREKLQSLNLEKQARFEAEIGKLKALIARTELDRSEQIARAKLEHLQTLRKSENQSKFLVTIASPPIYYLPAKHTKETKELVAASMEAYDAKMKASIQAHEEKLRKLEAEHATKLESLRDQLNNAQQEKKAAGTQVIDGKGEETLSDREEEMEQRSKEPETTKDEMSDASSQNSRMKAHDENSTPDNDIRDIVADDDLNNLRSDDGKKNDTSESMLEEERNSFSKTTGKTYSVAQMEGQEQPSSRKQVFSVDTQSDDVAKNATTEDITLETDCEAKAPERILPEMDAFVAKMKVAELRVELRKRGLDSKGLKVILVQRLQEAMHNE